MPVKAGGKFIATGMAENNEDPRPRLAKAQRSTRADADNYPASRLRPTGSFDARVNHRDNRAMTGASTSLGGRSAGRLVGGRIPAVDAFRGCRRRADVDRNDEADVADRNDGLRPDRQGSDRSVSLLVG